LSKTPRERCALPAKGHPNGAAIRAAGADGTFGWR
jgi:hypothetical protein